MPVTRGMKLIFSAPLLEKKKSQTKVLVNWNLVLKRFRIIQVLEGFRMCAVDGSCQVRSWHVPWAAL